jgi:2-succinyl-6-hydroxy-2,4-cyclohexadiene-1-carboxylate synthase
VGGGCGRAEYQMREVIDSSADEHLKIDVGDGVMLHVVRSGTGPPLVLLHGFTGSAETWSDLRRRMEDRFTIFAVDMTGHGRSSAPPLASRYALDRFADDLVYVLDEMQLDRVALAGYSMGGRAALRFALRHPARVSALVLESTSPGILDRAERGERKKADDARADMIERDGVAAFVDYWENLPLWNTQGRMSVSERSRLREQRLANSAEGLANSLRGAGAAADESVIDRLETLAVPALLIAGALDEKYVAIAEAMQRRWPAASVAIVPDAGHAVHLEQPKVFSRLIADFLVKD